MDCFLLSLLLSLSLSLPLGDTEADVHIAQVDSMPMLAADDDQQMSLESPRMPAPH